MADTITIPTPDGDMPAQRAAPDGPARGGVVVIQEAFGLTPHIGDVCDRLAAAGWAAIAPALFHREGAPVFADDDWEPILKTMGTLNPEGIAIDVDAAVDRLAEEGFPAERVAVIGFCMGGTVVLAAAARRPLGAAVTFYGGGVGQGRFGLPALVELAPGLQTPWLGLYGDRDKGIPVEDVERLRSAAAEAPVATEVVRYADADHAFHNDTRPQVYDEAAAVDAWGRTLAWLDRNIPAA
ncbi:MAG: hypothetical protein JWM05_1451 [Acidimicrobiales bacterium]|nr:hypothetical protein [Acidimicrobiales bacterium]